MRTRNIVYCLCIVFFFTSAVQAVGVDDDVSPSLKKRDVSLPLGYAMVSYTCFTVLPHYLPEILSTTGAPRIFVDSAEVTSVVLGTSFAVASVFAGVDLFTHEKDQKSKGK